MTQEPQKTNDQQLKMTQEEEIALAIMTNSVVNRNKDITDAEAKDVVRQMIDTKAQNDAKYANALEEFLQEEKNLTGKKRHDKALETFYYIQSEEFLSEAHNKINQAYQNENAGDTIDAFMGDMRHGDLGQIVQKSNALHLILSEENSEDQQRLVTIMMDKYAEEKKKDGFNFDAFMEGVARDYREYETEKINQEINQEIDDKFDAAIDQYYTGDKEQAKGLKDQMSMVHKMQLGTAIKNLADLEAKDELQDGQKEATLENYNQSMGKMVNMAQHKKVMDPLSREFQEMLEENYQGEKTAEKKAEMARYASPFFMQNIEDNIADEKTKSTAQYAHSDGAPFDEEKFRANLAYPTNAEIQEEAADLVRRMKEDVPKENLQAGLTAGYDDFAKDADKIIAEQEAAMRAAQEAQNPKPSRLSKFGTAALSIGAGAGVGFGVRTVFNAAAGYTALAGMSVAGITIAPVVAAVTIAVAGGLLAGSVSYAVSHAVQTAMAKGTKNFGANYKAGFSARSMRNSALLGGVAAGVVAGWGDQIAATAGNAWTSLFGGAADASAEAVAVAGADAGGWNFPGLGDLFGGNGDNTVAELVPGAGDASPAPAVDGAEIATNDTTAPLSILDGPADGVAEATDADAADANAELPTAVDADLKELIESVIRDAAAADGNPITAYESSIIARLGEGTLGQQVQAAKDASVLFGGELQTTILERLNEDFGNFLYCPEAIADPQLERAIGQVNADLGILQMMELMEADVADSATNTALTDAIVNVLQGDEAGNHYAERFVNTAEKCFPEAFEAAQAEHAEMAANAVCMTSTADVGTTGTDNPLYTPILCDEAAELSASDLAAAFTGAGDASITGQDAVTQHMNSEYGLQSDTAEAPQQVAAAEAPATPRFVF